MSLCSGSAFAWDKHLASMSNHGVAVAMDMAANHDHSDDFSQNGSYPDDHCSHGAAHLVGGYDASLKALNIDHSYRAVAVVSFPSLYISLLLRPPTSDRLIILSFFRAWLCLLRWYVLFL